MKNILTEKFSKRLLLIGVLLLLAGFILFIWNDLNLTTGTKLQADKVAQFGDFVGGLIGSIWALAGVILFYVALTEQRSDFATNREVLKAQTEALQQQIREFELQREELSETRKVFKIQSDTLKTQQFESTFFNLLNLHHSIVNSIDLRSKENKYERGVLIKKTTFNSAPIEKIIEITTGRDCFVKFCKGFRNEYEKISTDYPLLEDMDIIKKAYHNYYILHQSDLGHYFRNLYHIFKFIKNSEQSNKKRYTSLVRAQLSNDELFLLFYNCLSDNGNTKFLPLIEEFHILKNLNRKDFIKTHNHSRLYEKSAYGE